MRNTLPKRLVPLHNLHADNSCVLASHGLNLIGDGSGEHPENSLDLRIQLHQRLDGVGWF
jgi:hypothetical protein